MSKRGFALMRMMPAVVVIGSIAGLTVPQFLKNQEPKIEERTVEETFIIDGNLLTIIGHQSEQQKAANERNVRERLLKAQIARQARSGGGVTKKTPIKLKTSKKGENQQTTNKTSTQKRNPYETVTDREIKTNISIERKSKKKKPSDFATSKRVDSGLQSWLWKRDWERCMEKYLKKRGTQYARSYCTRLLGTRPRP